MSNWVVYYPAGEGNAKVAETLLQLLRDDCESQVRAMVQGLNRGCSTAQWRYDKCTLPNVFSGATAIT